MEVTSNAIPAFDTPQQHRAAVELEMQMCGLSDVERAAVMKQVDAYIIETIVATGAELLTTDRHDIRWSLWDIENRVLPAAPIAGEEMLSRVTAAAATRTNVVAGYNKLRERLSEQPAPPVPPPAAVPIPVAMPPMYGMFPPARPVLSRRGRLLVILAGIVITVLVMVWFMNVTGLATKMQHEGALSPVPAARRAIPVPQRR